MEKKIVFMHVFKNNKGFYEEALVKYDDHTEETVKGFGNVVDKITNFSMQEHTGVDELMKDDTKMKIEEKKEEKKSNALKITSIVVASVLAASAGIYAIATLRNKYRRNESDVKNEKKVVEVTQKPIITLAPTFTPTIKPTSTPTVKPTVNPTATLRPVSSSIPSIAKVETGTKVVDNGSKYLENLEENYVQMDDLCVRVRDYLDGTDRSEIAFNRILDDISNKCFSNMNELINFTNGQRMVGDIYLLTLYDCFDEGTIDYDILKYFCEKRNNIITNAFDYQNMDRTKNEIKKLLKDYTDFMLKKGYIYINDNKYYNYRNLDDFTKLILSDMNLFMLMPNVSYKATINGREYSKDKLMEIIQDQINDSCNNLYGLVSRVYTKK